MRQGFNLSRDYIKLSHLYTRNNAIEAVRLSGHMLCSLITSKCNTQGYNTSAHISCEHNLITPFLKYLINKFIHGEKTEKQAKCLDTQLTLLPCCVCALITFSLFAQLLLLHTVSVLKLNRSSPIIVEVQDSYTVHFHVLRIFADISFFLSKLSE